jgi:hypothetical protein
MASKQTYPCYVCKKAGYDNVRVYLDGRTADGKTIYKNEDMTPHVHKSSNNSSTVSGKTAQTETDTSSTQPKQQPRDESSEWGNLTHSELVTKVLAEYGMAEIIHRMEELDVKIEYLTKLVYVQTQLLQEKKSKQQEDFQKDRNLLDNR